MSVNGFFRSVGNFISFSKDLVNEVNGTNKAKREAEAKYEEWEKNMSVTCRKCNGLARPIATTHDRYKCLCGHQFAGAKHSDL